MTKKDVKDTGFGLPDDGKSQSPGDVLYIFYTTGRGCHVSSLISFTDRDELIDYVIKHHSYSKKVKSWGWMAREGEDGGKTKAITASIRKEAQSRLEGST